MGTTLYSGEITKREIRQQIVYLIKIIDGHYQFTREEPDSSSYSRNYKQPVRIVTCADTEMICVNLIVFYSILVGIYIS